MAVHTSRTRANETVLNLTKFEQSFRSELETMSSSLEDLHSKLLELMIYQDYATSRSSYTSNLIIDILNTTELTNLETTNAHIMDENAWKTNIKYIPGDSTPYKYGVIHNPKKYSYGQKYKVYSMENIDKDGKKHGVSEYDVISKCHWMIVQSTTGMGPSAWFALHKVVIDDDGEIVNTTARWNLRLIDAGTNDDYSYFSDVDVSPDGQWLILLIRSAYTGYTQVNYRGQGVLKLRINADGSLGLNNVGSGGTLSYIMFGASDDFSAATSLDTEGASGVPLSYTITTQNRLIAVRVWDVNTVAVLVFYGVNNTANVPMMRIHFLNIGDFTAANLPSIVNLSPSTSTAIPYPVTTQNNPPSGLQTFRMSKSDTKLIIKIVDAASATIELQTKRIVEIDITSANGLYTADLKGISNSSAMVSFTATVSPGSPTLTNISNLPESAVKVGATIIGTNIAPWTEVLSYIAFSGIGGVSMISQLTLNKNATGVGAGVQNLKIGYAKVVQFNQLFAAGEIPNGVSAPPYYTDCGIAFAQDKNLLEITSMYVSGQTPSYRPVMNKRKLINSYWAESQLTKKYKIQPFTFYSGGVINYNAVNPTGITYYNDYFWVASSATDGGGIKLYRYGKDKTIEFITLNNTDTTFSVNAMNTIVDITTDGTTMWILAAYQVGTIPNITTYTSVIYQGLLSDIIAQFTVGRSIDLYSWSSTRYVLTNGRVATSMSVVTQDIGGVPTSRVYILSLPLTTQIGQSFIDIIADGTTYQSGFAQLPILSNSILFPSQTTAFYFGLHCTTNSFYLKISSGVNNLSGKIFTFDAEVMKLGGIIAATSAIHTYQDPTYELPERGSSYLIGNLSFDPITNELLTIDGFTRVIYSMKTLEGPSVIQTSSFLYGVVPEQITTIQKRRFDPEEYYEYLKVDKLNNNIPYNNLSHYHDGTANMINGYNWAGTNQTFIVAGVTLTLTIDYTVSPTPAEDIVYTINSWLTTNSILAETYIIYEILDVPSPGTQWKRIGIRGTTTTTSLTISGTALATLGMIAGTYQGYVYQKIKSRRNVPDLYYYGAIETNRGFGLLHLDNFFAPTFTSSGEPRYDSRNIRQQWSGSTVINPPVAATFNTSKPYVCDGAAINNKIAAVDDIVIGGGVVNGFIFDIKNGSITVLARAAYTASGKKYAGTWSERNKNIGFDGIYKSEWDFPAAGIHYITAASFSKTDESEYNEATPTTFIIVSTETPPYTGNIIKLSWDSNNERSISYRYNSAFLGGAYPARFSAYIAPSGIVFYDCDVSNVGYTNKPIWDMQWPMITSDYTLIPLTGFTTGNITSITPGPVYKNVFGVWEYYLNLSRTNWSNFGAVDYLNVQTKTLLRVYTSPANYRLITSNSYENTTIVGTATNANGYGGFSILERRQTSDRAVGYGIYDDTGWISDYPMTYGNATDYNINWNSSPLFSVNRHSATAGWIVTDYDSIHNMITVGCFISGMQFIFLPKVNQTVHNSINFNITQSSKFLYKNTVAEK